MALTLSQEENLKFLKRAIEYAGFGKRYNQTIDQGFKAGGKEIALEPFISPMGENSAVRYRPQVEEGKDQGRYNFIGFEARLADGKKKPVKHFFPNVASAGMTTENAKRALQGATVRHSEYNQKRTPKQYPVYTRLDFSRPLDNGKGFAAITVNAEHVPILKLLNNETINSQGQDREKQINLIIAQLEAGERVPVPIKEKINNEIKNSTVYFQLNLTDSKTMEMRISDEHGALLRNPKVEVKNPQIKQTVGFTMDEVKSSKAHETFAKLFNDHDTQQQKKGVGVK